MTCRKVCAICGIRSVSGCSQCRIKYYCSKEHQASHWAIVHKEECLPIHLRMDPDIQRKVYVAKRGIKEGQVIFANKPFMIFPIIPLHMFPDQVALRQTGSLKICMGCCKDISPGEGQLVSNKAQKCSICKWPVCNETCANRPFHAKLECEILSQRVKYPNSPLKEMEYYNMIYILRALLMRSVYPHRWEMLMSKAVQATNEHLTNTSKNVQITHAIAFVRGECKQVQFEKELIKRVYWILDGNLKADSRLLFCAKLENMSENISQGCLYNLISYHCSSVDDPESSPLEKVERHYFAMSDIAKGESLKLPIISIREVSGTFWRRKALFESTGIQCACKLCKDPTEFGTFMSAMRCQICQPEYNDFRESGEDSDLGYLLPVNPLLENSVWKCNKCSKELPADTILPVVTDLEKSLAKLDNQSGSIVVNVMNRAFQINDSVLNKNQILSPEDSYVVQKLVDIIPEGILPDLARLLLENQAFLHRNHYVNIRGWQAYLDYLYFYMCLNRSLRFVPSSMNLRETYGFHMREGYRFSAPTPEKWLELNKNLYSYSANILRIFQRIYPERSVSSGRLFFYMAFSRWTTLRHEKHAMNAKHPEDYDQFLADLNEWSQLKRKADNCFRHKVEVLIHGVDNTGGFVETLEKLDCYDPNVNKEAFSKFMEVAHTLINC